MQPAAARASTSSAVEPRRIQASWQSRWTVNIVTAAASNGSRFTTSCLTEARNSIGRAIYSTCAGCRPILCQYNNRDRLLLSAAQSGDGQMFAAQVADILFTAMHSFEQVDDTLKRAQASAGTAVLIDAANEADRLLELIGDTPVSSIVTTHRHWDHWQGAPRGGLGDRRGGHRPPQTTRLSSRSRPPAWSAAATGWWSARPASPSSTCAATPRAASRCATTPDGTLAGSPHLFTGDSLFPGGPGNTEGDPKRFKPAHGRPGGAGVRRAARCHLGLYPGHGKGHHARGRAPARGRVARAGLVAPPAGPGAEPGRNGRARGYARAGQRIWAA